MLKKEMRVHLKKKGNKQTVVYKQELRYTKHNTKQRK